MEKYYRWSEEDLEDLDAKFDALAEFLEIEFVFERVSDGSDVADKSRCYARRKESTGNQWPEPEYFSKNKRKGDYYPTHHL